MQIKSHCGRNEWYIWYEAAASDVENWNSLSLSQFFQFLKKKLCLDTATLKKRAAGTGFLLYSLSHVAESYAVVEQWAALTKINF